MYLLLNLILQLFFIYFAILIGIPGTSDNNILFNKLILFIGILIFQFFIKIIINMKRRCKILLKNIMVDSLLYGILAMIGYSFYLDLSLMDSTKEMFDNFNENIYLYPFIVSALITSLILFVSFFQVILNLQNDKCEKYREIYNL